MLHFSLSFSLKMLKWKVQICCWKRKLTRNKNIKKTEAYSTRNESVPLKHIVDYGPERASVQIVLRLVCPLGDNRQKNKETQGTVLSWMFIWLNGILSNFFFFVSFITFVTKELNIFILISFPPGWLRPSKTTKARSKNY